MRSRWTAALATAVALMFAGPLAASATDPVDLGSGFVLDQSGVLSSGEADAAQERLARLSDETDVDLWVVFVDDFTSPSDSAQWAEETAVRNGLGPYQYLLAVATDGRQFYLSGDPDGPVSDDNLGDIERELITPMLRQDDWAGAVNAAAEGLTNASGGGSVRPGGLPVLGIVVAVVAVGAIGVVIWLVIRGRRKKTPAAVEQVSTEELARRAASALVQTDDAIRTSEQELGFARAQFGDTAAAEFDRVLAAAKDALTQAFTLQQQLDDGTPDTDEQTRAWNTEILRLCEEADAALDEKTAAFDELRKLEQDAPAAVARVQAARATAVSDLDAAEARLSSLSTSYAPEALSTVADNPAQARERIAFADARLTEAQTAVAADRRGEAAVAIRSAEEAVGQAALLEKAIDKLGDDLAAGEKSAAALLVELEGDIAAAATLPDTDGRLAAAVAATRQQIDGSRALLRGAQKRPLAALQALEAANQNIDTLIQGVRDAAAQRERARQVVGQQILQAQAQVSTAEDYVTARRGAIGAEARTRLAEAGASLVQAQQLQESAPEQATQHAQRATQLAGLAIQAAQRDVGAFGGGSGGSGDGGMMGAVLGGLVLNSLLGGGGGGSSRRSSGGFGGGFGGGGRRSSGGFGGGSRRSSGGGSRSSRRGGGRF